MDAAHAPVRAYHQRSKHHLQRYAAGPQALDWDAQPDPFRRWAGAALVTLPLAAHTLQARWGDLFVPGRCPGRTADLAAIGALFELSFALTAWKQQGPDRWALRANPSSGNLHPTEAYVLAAGVAGLADGVYHYAPREHALEQRALWGPHDAAEAADAADAADAGDAGDAADAPCVWVGLSSIQWREAWKYGERAFRYCQLDAGHALGALRHAAAVLGWQARVVSGVGHAELAALLGLSREADFGDAEREEPELLVQLGPALPRPPGARAAGARWQGRANRLDAHPMYRWPAIDDVALATRAPGAPAIDLGAAPAARPAAATVVEPVAESAAESAAAPVAPAPRHATSAALLIRQRRSAQRFDGRGRMTADAFFRMLAALLPGRGAALPWDVWPHAPRVHAVLYAHRVEGLAAGAYVLPRSDAGAALLRQALRGAAQWQPVAQAPAGLPLARIAENPALAGTLRTLSCHQAIAGEACFALSLLAGFDAALDAAPWRYRQLLQEAGLIGQVLYLQAEAEGLRGTGIGCYFDDAVHELLGIEGMRAQVLYHFTVGVPLVDERIRSEPPYPQRAPAAAPD